MKHSAVPGFVAVAIALLVLGIVIANQTVKMHYSLSALSGGSNIYASIGANIELGRIDDARAGLRVLAWTDRINHKYAICMDNIWWHLFTARPYETCRHLIEAPMPENWQIPGLAKAIKTRAPVSGQISEDPGL